MLNLLWTFFYSFWQKYIKPSGHTDSQCDHMLRLFSNLWPFITMKFCTVAYEISKAGTNLCQIRNKNTKSCPKIFKIDSGQQGQLTLSFLEKIFEERGVRSKAGTAFVTTLLTVGIITF